MSVTSEAQHMSESAAKDLYEYLTALIKQAVTTYLAQEKIQFDVEELPIDLRFSAQSSFGDYSMPVMSWQGKKRLGRPALPMAEALVTILQDMNIPIIKEITPTRPGYINFRLNRPEVGKAIMERVLDDGPDFGQNNIGAGTKVIVEHTNINSNKAAHVGHLRNACIGDTVVRMLRSQGYQVEADNYIDDSGVQVADVVVGFTLLQKGELQLPGGNEQLPGESFDYYCSRVYVAVQKVYEEELALIQAAQEQQKAAAEQAKESAKAEAASTDEKTQTETPASSEAEQTSVEAATDTVIGAASALRREVLRAIEHGDEPESGPDYPTLAKDISQQIVQAHLKTMSRLNISYDLLPWESVILKAGLWKRTFEVLQQRDLLEKPETGPTAGCWILPYGDGESQTNEGDRTSDKILVRSDGTATYTAKDIAYQLWKLGITDELDIDVHFSFVPWGVQHDGRKLWTMRPATDTTPGSEEADPKRFGHARRAINVIDVRQSYLQQVVYESVRRLGFAEQADNSRHLAYEVVTLSAATAAQLGIDTSDGRESYAMSGRKGIEIKADDLINAAIKRMLEVRRQDDKPETTEATAAALAASAIRYFMIRFNLQQVIALDMDEVLRSKGDTGVYLQYAYARANSILRRLQETGYEIPAQLEELPEQLEQSEWELLRHIDAYPRRLAEATEQLAPPMLASYTYDLAAHFSDFFEHTPPIVRETDERIKAFRAWLVQATVQTMNNVLRTLGFEPLERI